MKVFTPLTTTIIASITAFGLAFALSSAHAEPILKETPPSKCEFNHVGRIQGGPEMHEPGMPPFLFGINLTEAQKDQLFAIFYPEIPKIRESMKQHHALQTAMEDLTNNGHFNEAEANKLAEKLANLEKEKWLSRARMDNQVMAILTPEQREQAIKNKEQFVHGPHRMPTGFHHYGGAFGSASRG